MEKPIRILHIVPNMDAGGIETLIMNLYRNIDKNEFQFDFLMHYQGHFFYDDEIKKLGGRIYNLSFRNDNNIIKYLYELNDFFKKHDEYEIVHDHMVSTGAICLYYAKKNNVPIRIIHSHNTNTTPDLKGKVKKVLAGLSPKYANVYFACGKKAGQALYGEKGFYTIHNGIDTNKFKFNKRWRKEIRDELNIDDDTIVFGHVGRFNAQKNHTFLLSVFKSIVLKNKNSKFLLIGDGELKEKILSLAVQLKLTDHLIYLGIRRDVYKIYQAMDIFILPSLFEGFPVVATECQAAGLPMLVADTVSSEIKITPLVKFLSLDDSTMLWADTAIDMAKKERHDTSSIVRAAGFDIKDEAVRLQNMYNELLKNKIIK